MSDTDHRPTANPEPPKPDGYPLLGNTLDFIRADNPIEFLSEACREEGDLVKIELPGNDVYVTQSPEDAAKVFNSDNYKKSTAQQEGFESFMGNDILVSEGELWRHQRKVLSPLIARNRVADFAPEMIEYTEEMMDSWEDGQTVDVNSEMASLTVQIACRVLFDWDARDYGDAIGENLKTVTGHLFRSSLGVSAPDWVPTPKNRRYQKSLETMNRIADEIIADRKRADDDADDLITRTREMEDQIDREITDDELRAKVMTMLFAGHETTAQGLTFAFYLLAQHSGVRRKLQEEIESELGDRRPTPEDVAEMEYLEAVMRETLRLYSPGYSVSREPVEDDELSGYHVPAGSTVIVFSWGMHRNPRVWDRPHAFEPERWLGDEPPTDYEFAYAPFAGGPRRCAGEQFAMLESKLVLATISQEYELELITEPPLEFEVAVTTRPKHGVDVIPRER